MSFRPTRIVLLSLVYLLSIFPVARNLDAQTPAGGLNGVVTDPSGGVIAKAAVRLTNASGASLDTTTNRDGFYEFKGLVPGTYAVKAVAKGFAIFTQQDVQILSGQPQHLNIGLLIQVEEEKVEVSDSSTRVDIAPSNNAGMVVMQGKDLEALSDDPDELQSELQTLAGPSAGPNGGQIYIDGFTGGTLPPKASIREIRINQNPFSAEYDRLGYGRVEILTKPGTDQFHGQLISVHDIFANRVREAGRHKAAYRKRDNHQRQADRPSQVVSDRMAPFVATRFQAFGRDRLELRGECGQCGQEACRSLIVPDAAATRPRLHDVVTDPRIDIDAYNPSQRVVAWFTPDDCMVLEQ